MLKFSFFVKRSNKNIFELLFVKPVVPYRLNILLHGIHLLILLLLDLGILIHHWIHCSHLILLILKFSLKKNNYYRGVVITPLTFRSEVISLNPVVRGVIAVIPGSFFRGERCYSSHSENQEKLTKHRDFYLKCVKKIIN